MVPNGHFTGANLPLWYQSSKGKDRAALCGPPSILVPGPTLRSCHHGPYRPPNPPSIVARQSTTSNDRAAEIARSRLASLSAGVTQEIGGEVGGDTLC